MLFTCHIQLLSKTFDTNSALHMDLSRKCFIYPLATHGLIYPLDSHGLIYPLTTQASFIHLLHSLICPLAKKCLIYSLTTKCLIYPLATHGHVIHLPQNSSINILPHTCTYFLSTKTNSCTKHSYTVTHKDRVNGIIYINH